MTANRQNTLKPFAQGDSLTAFDDLFRTLPASAPSRDMEGAAPESRIEVSENGRHERAWWHRWLSWLDV